MPEIVKRSIDDKYDDENKKEIQLQDIVIFNLLLKFGSF